MSDDPLMKARRAQILKEAAQSVEVGKLAPRMDQRSFDLGGALAQRRSGRWTGIHTTH